MKKKFKSESFQKIILIISDVALFLLSLFGKHPILTFVVLIPLLILILVGYLGLHLSQFNLQILESDIKTIELKNKKLELILSDNANLWLDKINNSKIEVQNRECTGFKLNEDRLRFNEKLAYKSFPSMTYFVSENTILRDSKKYIGLYQAINEITNLNNNITDVWFLAQGYADTSLQPEKLYFLDKTHFYDKISYYPYIENEKKYLINDKNLSSVYLNDTYKNKDLIYLRSYFVIEKYFKPISSNLNIDYNLGIIEGKLIKERDIDFRRVDIYILFCSQNSIERSVGIWGF